MKKAIVGHGQAKQGAGAGDGDAPAAPARPARQGRRRRARPGDLPCPRRAAASPRSRAATTLAPRTHAQLQARSQLLNPVPQALWRARHGAAGAARRRRRRPQATIGAPCMHCSKKPASSWPAGCCPRPTASAQVELDSRQARQGQGRQRAAEASSSPRRPSCSREAQALARRDRARPGLGIRARRANSASPTWRATTSAPRPTLAQQAAALFAPVRGAALLPPRRQGPLQKAPAEILSRRWLGIEKKKQVAAQIDAWAAELAAGSCPAPIREQLYKILFKPDKNAPEYKAVVEASRAHAHARRWTCCRQAGAIDSPYQFHWQRFLFENFPKGTGFPPLQAPAIKDELPLAPRAGVLDRRLQHHRDRRRAVGAGPGQRHGHARHPHRRAGPGARSRAAPSTRWRAQRLSTVYMPGYKITMLPDDVVQAYTLHGGPRLPGRLALRDASTKPRWRSRTRETRLERVPIAANLRHDQLDARRHRGTGCSRRRRAAPSYRAARAELAFLFRLARHLKAQREVVRGKPENFNRPDYNFRLDGNDGAEPHGRRAGADHACASAARRST